MQAFAVAAAPEQRKVLWTQAHERWVAWQFARDDPNQHVIDICWSDLDYAVVGYARECMDEAGRDHAMRRIRDDIQALEERWHPSLSDIIAAWNRLLSQFQPYAHASQVTTKADEWLPETKTYWPFLPSANVYSMMKYHVHFEGAAIQL